MSQKRRRLLHQSSLPKTCKQVATFLGMVEWFSKTLSHVSELCEPLYALKGKSIVCEVCRVSAAQRSFELLKGALVSPPVLAYPNY